jgi:hypothetical protein
VHDGVEETNHALGAPNSRSIPMDDSSSGRYASDARDHMIVFECECGSEEPVTRRQAADAAPQCRDPIEAAELFVLMNRGWWKHASMGLMCPGCIERHA